MSDQTPVDGQVLAAAVQALKVSPRFTGGVVRDTPWNYVPYRAYVYRERSEFGHVDSGHVVVEQYFGVEVCFPFTEQRDGSTDIELLGDQWLADVEELLFKAPDLGVNAELRIDGIDAMPLPQPHGQTRVPLARAVVLCAAKYSRGEGTPRDRAASNHPPPGELMMRRIV